MHSRINRTFERGPLFLGAVQKLYVPVSSCFLQGKISRRSFFSQIGGASAGPEQLRAELTDLVEKRKGLEGNDRSGVAGPTERTLCRRAADFPKSPRLQKFMKVQPLLTKLPI